MQGRPTFFRFRLRNFNFWHLISFSVECVGRLELPAFVDGDSCGFRKVRLRGAT
jgi:hypothetical protein